MKKLFSVTLIIFLTQIALAQRLLDAPVGTAEIDGFIEDAWDVCPEQAIDLPYDMETPTVTSFFKIMHDANNLYVIVNVIDEGNHYPGWKSGGNDEDYDNVKLYFDFNKELKDGLGPSTNFSGHYVFSESFNEGNYGKPITVAPTAPGDRNQGGTYCYSLYDEDYVFEVAIPYTNLYDKDSVQLSMNLIRERGGFGFDVVLTDQDEGKTTKPQRVVWNSDSLDLYENMDDAGTINIRTNDPCWWFDVSPLSLIIDSEAKINVVTNLNWTVESDQAWLTPDPKFGKQDSEITLRAEPNNSDKERSARVTVKLYYVEDTISVKVTQLPYTSALTFDNGKDLMIYPSVVKNHFMIKGLTHQADISLFDITGKKLLSKSVGGQEFIPITHLNKGIYIAEIEIDNRKIIKRLIKE